MGVMPGDILVPTFPATIKIAFFLVYRTDETKLSALARIIQDGEEVAKAEFDATVIDPKDPWVVILPMALATFEKEATLQLLMSFAGGKDEEIVRRKVRLSATASPIA